MTTKAAPALCNALTSQVIYTDEERELILAVDAYRRANHRPYPTCREILAVARALGYRRVEAATALPRFRGVRKGKGE